MIAELLAARGQKGQEVFLDAEKISMLGRILRRQQLSDRLLENYRHENLSIITSLSKTREYNLTWGSAGPYDHHCDQRRRGVRRWQTMAPGRRSRGAATTSLPRYAHRNKVY
jgi:hypothetical protein